MVAWYPFLGMGGGAFSRAVRMSHQSPLFPVEATQSTSLQQRQGAFCQAGLQPKPAMPLCGRVTIDFRGSLRFGSLRWEKRCVSLGALFGTYSLRLATSPVTELP